MATECVLASSTSRHPLLLPWRLLSVNWRRKKGKRKRPSSLERSQDEEERDMRERERIKPFVFIREDE